MWGLDFQPLWPALMRTWSTTPCALLTLLELVMVLTLLWWGSAMLGPAMAARHAMNRGRVAMSRRQYTRAAQYLRRAARFEPLREEAVCLIAEAAIREHRPGDALFALNTFVMEREELGVRERSSRVRLLRGIAGCMLGRAAAARRELGNVSRKEADVDERLAAAQACVMADDCEQALSLLETIPPGTVGGPLQARIGIVRAAAYYRRGLLEAARVSLPPASACIPADAALVTRMLATLGPPAAAAAPARLAPDSPDAAPGNRPATAPHPRDRAREPHLNAPRRDPNPRQRAT